MLEAILWVIVGVITGLVMKTIPPNSGVGGWIGDVIIGVIGAVFGGWLAEGYAIGHATPYFWLVSSLVAAAVAPGPLLVVHALTNDTTRNFTAMKGPGPLPEE